MVAFNASRASDGVSAQVKDWEKALDDFNPEENPAQEFLAIKGHLLYKNIHSSRKTVTNVGKTPRPSIAYPIHMIDLLKDYLFGLKTGLHPRLEKEGKQVNKQVFFCNIEGKLASKGELTRFRN